MIAKVRSLFRLANSVQFSSVVLAYSLQIATAGDTRAAATQPSPSEFDTAFSAVHVKYRITDPAAVERAYHQFADLIERFPADPHVWKAKLEAARVLDSATDEKINLRAASYYNELLPLADPSTADGRGICDAVINYDLSTRAANKEAYTRTQAVLDRYEEWAKKQTSRADLVHVWARKGDMLTWIGPRRHAIQYMLERLKDLEGWFNHDYGGDFKDRNRTEYDRMVSAREELLKPLAGAIGSSLDLDVDDQFAKAKLEWTYSALLISLNQWRSLHSLPGADQPIADIVDRGTTLPASTPRRPSVPAVPSGPENEP